MQRKYVHSAILVVSLSLFGNSSAQNSYQLPQITPPSPAASNFMRYGEIPIDFSTGVPNISIPLYTVTSRKLQMPLSISYHASGIKVDDRASVIGLGWVLNAGGLIASTTLDQEGDAPIPLTFPTVDSFTSERTRAQSAGLSSFVNFSSYLNLDNQYYDKETDRYFYQLPNGKSGVFRFEIGTDSLILLPYAPLKVKKIIGGNSNYPSGARTGFIITDDKGIAYTFLLPAGGQVGTSISNWDLQSIVSADKTDTIRFIYKSSENKYYTPSFTSLLQYGEVRTSDAGADYNIEVNLSTSITPGSLYTSERILDSIISASTIVTFKDTSDRQDMPISTGNFRMRKISVYSRFFGSLIKSFTFNQSYFGTSGLGNLRLRLDSVLFNGQDNATVETYKIKYNQSYELPPYNSYGSYSIDFWGYSNGVGGNSLVPSEFVPDTVYATHTGPNIAIPSYYSMPRSPNHTYAAAALISEIDYPTGGKTVFSFEPNYAQNAYEFRTGGLHSGNVGGFRIQQISNYTDSLTLASYKTYQYSLGEIRTINSDLFSYNQRNFWGGGGYLNCMYQLEYFMQNTLSSPFLPLSQDNCPPVFYDTVAEYIGNVSGNTGKTVYYYEHPPYTTYASYDEIRFQDPYEFDRGNYIPKLSKKIVFANNLGSYMPVSETDNTYFTFRQDRHNMGLHYVQLSDYPNSAQGLDYNWIGAYCPFYSTTGYPLFFNVYQLAATQEVELLTQTDQYSYSLDGTSYLRQTTNYQYDTVNLEPIYQYAINSKGDTLQSSFQYPSSFPTTSPYDTMLVRNIITPLIQKNDYKNSSFLQSVKTNYKLWSNDSLILDPESVQTTVGSNPADVRLQYHNYDAAGNILEVSKKDDAVHSYIYDYNSVYPIAEVNNAPFASIAYTSFEADGKGNWDYASSGALPDSGSVTGHKGYTLATGNVQRTALDTSKAYVVTYWLKNNGGSASINGGGAGTLLVTKNGWKLYQQERHGDTTLTISGTGVIDELRLYPKNSQMITYTYDPLIGVTSQCDANNRITFFEYDNFGRLLRVRDQDLNILKRYEYKYKEAQ